MNPNESQIQHVVDLDNDLAIYKIHLDCVQEQDVNAQVMSADKMRRLAANMAADRRLESFPFGVLKTNKAEVMKFHVISGHHRCRTARMAGLEFIYVLVDTRDLTHDQVASKQLAHNALIGTSDASILQQIYFSIEDMDLKVSTGLTDVDIAPQTKTVEIEDLAINIDFQEIHVLFLPNTYEQFEKLFSRFKNSARVELADYSDWDRFKEVANQAGAKFKVRNAASILAVLIDLAHERMDQLDSENS